MSFCASCGVAEGDGDDVKLKDCSACHLVKYCGVKCQKEHRKQHKRACKQRAAELRDELLFKQPESSYMGDCPICCLPHLLDPGKSVIMPCCSKVICRGCTIAGVKREEELNLPKKCPFCRYLCPESVAEAKQLKDRADKNDPIAMREEGIRYCEERDYQNALKHFSKAVELGDVGSHYELAILYFHGHGVEKDKLKELYHYEQAAIGGHNFARFNLGAYEWNAGRRERAVKHWIIAAKLGCDKSLGKLKVAFKSGLASKDDFEAALRGHQAAVDATKSPQRDEAEALYKRLH